MRVPAPDLARGLMLLAIAFAHAPLFVVDIDRGPAVLNDLTNGLHNLFVSNHARPMFAFLFGYSLVQLLDRRTRRGSAWVDVRKLLHRRGWWLALIGFVHMAVLVPIDILAAYGISAVLLVGLLRAKDSTLLWTAGLSLVPATAMVGFAMWYPLSQGLSPIAAGSVAAGMKGPWQLFAERLQAWPFGLVAGVILVVPGVIFGVWAARRRLLDEPARHRRFLVNAAIVTTAVSVIGAVPVGLVQLGVWAEPSGAALWAAALAQPLTGYFGGIGMAAIIGLIAIPVTRRPNGLATAVQALGQRSMSLYLFQSLVFVGVFYPYGLDLQDDLGLAGATGVAAATWLVSVVIAEVMRRAGYRGPAEILLRRLAYR
ncbi:DUF418 domain-containing protein [Nonomuraea turcica]|uniref:DUF418 domain-containing protein n=1 Tax=Nonomuraea sp. G32 TaxID=3067274 RepID=UPI00273C26FC|nr:DUF418 domain-containing protein [Nonomuraea sp. G32]MDP4503768.1 DUF418 domain-containing protein [Nonomuraea sp. G32]